MSRGDGRATQTYCVDFRDEMRRPLREFTPDPNGNRAQRRAWERERRRLRPRRTKEDRGE